MKRILDDMPLSKIAFVSRVLSGIAWLAVSASVWIRGEGADILRGILIVAAILLNAFQLLSVYPKDKEDEMAKENLNKAEVAALTGVKIFIPVLLLFLLIVTLFCWKKGVTEIPFAYAILLGVSVLIGLLGLINILVGFFFRKYEKE